MKNQLRLFFNNKYIPSLNVTKESESSSPQQRKD